MSFMAALSQITCLFLHLTRQALLALLVLTECHWLTVKSTWPVITRPVITRWYCSLTLSPQNLYQRHVNLHDYYSCSQAWEQMQILWLPHYYWL